MSSIDVDLNISMTLVLADNSLKASLSELADMKISASEPSHCGVH